MSTSFAVGRSDRAANTAVGVSRALSGEEIEALPPPVGPPKRAGLLGEIGTLFQPTRLLLGSGTLRRAPRGDGRISVFVPGWKAPEATTAPIRAYLGALGHDARTWGLGINRGDVEARRDQMVGIIQQLAASSGRSVNLVGWSLGGVVAREIARVTPDAVHRVVTYGTPVIGGPTYTAGWKAFGEAECARVAALQDELDTMNPVVTPITAIFTRQDSVVDWRACIDRRSPSVSMVEVGSTHIGLGIDPDVWMIVAQALSAPSGSPSA